MTMTRIAQAIDWIVQRPLARRAGLALLVLLIATVWQALRPFGTQNNESSDYTVFYEPVARAILAGAGVTTPQGELATAYPPGFPLFLAGVFGAAHTLGLAEALALWLSQLLCLLVATFLIDAIASAIFGGRVALLAALLWAAYPPLWWLAKQPSSELPFVVLLYLAIYGGARLTQLTRPSFWAALATGGAAGAAALVRPIALVLGPALALALIVPRPGIGAMCRIALASMILAGALAAVAPWELAVWRRAGDWIPLASNGPASMRDGLTFALAAPPKEYRLGLPLAPDTRLLMEEIAQLTSAGRLATSGAVMGYVAQAANERPATIARLYAWKAARAWYATDSNRGELWSGLLQIPYLALAVAGAFVAYRAGGERRRFLWLALAIIGAFWIMTILALSILRYMTPIMGLLHILAAAALDRFVFAVSSVPEDF